jgi:hypothetical protein
MLMISPLLKGRRLDVLFVEPEGFGMLMKISIIPLPPFSKKGDVRR